jgi:hypothetical protein
MLADQPIFFAASIIKPKNLRDRAQPAGPLLKSSYRP